MKRVVNGAQMFVYEMHYYEYDDSETVVMAHPEALTVEEILKRCFGDVVTSAPACVVYLPDLERIGFVTVTKEIPIQIDLWKLGKG